VTDVDAAYRRYFPLIREKCRRMLGEGEADDVAQETFLRLWKSELQDDDPRRLTAWIYRTCTRLAIDRMRERARRAVDDDGDEKLAGLPSRAPAFDESLENRRLLERLARELPREELEMALLHRLDGLTQAEIAEVTRVTDRTVRRCLVRLDARVAKLNAEVAS
jgi:RNA polymerase sigma-70 factor (ECF subfamily)